MILISISTHAPYQLFIYLFIFFLICLPPSPPQKRTKPRWNFLLETTCDLSFPWDRIKFFKRESKPLTRSLKMVICCCSFTILLSPSCKLNFQSHWPLAKRILLFCIFDLFSGLTQWLQTSLPTKIVLVWMIMFFVFRQWLALQKLRRKVKKKVDTKASKGRKIRWVLTLEPREIIWI